MANLKSVSQYATLPPMTIIQSIILGIIEGVTEFLPISSTGHMIITAHFLNIKESATLMTFEIMVQAGAIAAVLVSFYKKFLDITTLKKLFIAFLPTAIVGVTVFPYLKSLLTNPLLVAVTLFIGGVIIIIMEYRYDKLSEEGNIIEIFDISYKNAFLLGVFQALAVIPGVSRSGAIIVGGLWRRLSRKLVIEFAFLLAVPTMLSATAYTLLKKNNELTIEAIPPLIIGTIVSFIVALLVIQFMLSYVRRHSFIAFGIYRIIVGTILFLVLI